MFYYETTPVESKTFWIFVQCGRAIRMPCKNNFSIYQDPKLNRVVSHVQIDAFGTQELN